MGQPMSLPCCSARDGKSHLQDQYVQTGNSPMHVAWVNPNPWVDNPQWTQLQRVAKYALHLMEPHKRPLAWYHCRGYHGQERCQRFIMAMDVDHETRNCPTCGHPWGSPSWIASHVWHLWEMMPSESNQDRRSCQIELPET